MTAQLEYHGIYLLFMAFVVALVATCVVECIREARTKRSRR